MAVLAVPHPPFFCADQDRAPGPARDVNLAGQRDLSTDFLQMGPLVMAQTSDEGREKFFASGFVPNVRIFCEQIETLKTFLATATPDESQQKDTDFLLALGELFTLVVYGQLILENARLYKVDDDTVDQIFDFMVRDFSKYALQLYSKPSTTPQQMDLCLKMLRKPVVDAARFGPVWQEIVHPLKDAYEMKP